MNITTHRIIDISLLQFRLKKCGRLNKNYLHSFTAHWRESYIVLRWNYKLVPLLSKEMYSEDCAANWKSVSFAQTSYCRFLFRVMPLFVDTVVAIKGEKEKKTITTRQF